VLTSLKKKQKNLSQKKKLMKKKSSLLTKEIIFIPSTLMDILTPNPQKHFTLIIPITIISNTTTLNMANRKIGNASSLCNTTPMKISLQRKILTNSLNEDLGTTQSNLPLGLNLLIARHTLYHSKNKKIFRNSLTRTFILDVSTL